MSSEMLPRFSVIIPVYGVEGYVRECLDSVISQSYPDFEVIAVDDRSPDNSGAILDEFAARDARVRVVHHAENGGIGAARNTGVGQARGDYLLFLDGDDSMRPGTLQAIAARLAEAEDPDVLLFDHVATYWNGKVEPSTSAPYLAGVRGRVVSPAEHQDLLRVIAVVWNRAYRREFFAAEGFRFSDGLYEDSLMVYTSMAAARRVASLEYVCVEYRQRRRGSSMRSSSPRAHFVIFDQYQRIFDYLDTRPDGEVFRGIVFERMISHFLHTFARGFRIPKGYRRAYLRQAAKVYGRLKPAGYREPAGILGLKFKVLATGSYAAFEALKVANGTRERAQRTVRRLKRFAGRRVLRAYYALQRRLPIDENLAVYSAYWGRTPSCNPLAVHEAARRLAPGIRAVWAVDNKYADSLPPGIRRIAPSTLGYWRAMARAKYFVNNVNFPDAVVKRRGQVHLQTHHGTPLKRMGIDQRHYPAVAGSMNFDRLLGRVDRWDYSLSSNPHSTEHWARVYPSSFETLDAGYPRNDVYYRATASDVERVRGELGIAPGRTAVLYAPTLRDHQRDGYVPRLDLARVARDLGPDFVLLARAHYSYGGDPELTALAASGAVVDVSRHPSVEELCLASDALVTDYSSVMFDYANLDRPIVTYADDWEAYRTCRGVTFDLLSGRPGETPGVIATTEGELVEAFRSGAWAGGEAAKLRQAFRERFCAWDDGFAAERVVRRVFLGEEATRPAVVPLEQRTPAPAPRRSEGRTVPQQSRREGPGQLAQARFDQ
ncbi:bifunctional glycosyltransferase family 2 protein/CDP-glycerol:glycerophosphate glycerophosphotransferase [Streptomyces sp. NPDC051940]|uniref:bifunctional glycosyltransferase/CDP-glycerol:glycerophosphate glycerophosphotransferase n=1 Tax=Streptomyces sp. NPDC051940 TaxID=3155675 RepID=UPI00341CDBDB